LTFDKKYPTNYRLAGLKTKTRSIMLHKTTAHNKKTRLTRSWIFESLMLLMDQKPYEKITVSDITQKAGIARQTFYRSYADKNALLLEYFGGMINIDLQKTEDSNNSIADTIVLTINYAYMRTQRERIKKILACYDFLSCFVQEIRELYLRILEAYKDTFSPEDFLMFRYKLEYEASGCFHVFFDWFTSDSPVPVEHIVSMLNAMNVSETGGYGHIPNILVRISED
jgi:AcrR family transcriptional regulator